jgi:prevent-host-death family protein
VAILLAIIAKERDREVRECGRGQESPDSILGRSQKKKEPIVVTSHGKPYALIQPISEKDLEELGWDRLAADRLRQAWEGEDDTLYDYL